MLSQVVGLFLLSALASADLLKNPGFESPPSGLPKSSGAFAALSSKNNTIPGWTFGGSVVYVTSSDTIALPGNGHALQLAGDGFINQTFVADGDLTDYLLTFSVARGGANCSLSADLVVSAPDSSGVFSFKERYGREDWQSYGHFLGAWGEGESVNLVIHSQTPETESTSICWPIIDELILKSITKPDQDEGNLLSNEGFEFGPEFLSGSSEGILINPTESPTQSPLLDWAVLGTVRYIDSGHFLVPQGKAAVEIVSAGIQTGAQLAEGSSYSLEFKLGDANNSCVEDFVVEAQAGTEARNFTFSSRGTGGSAKNFSMTFKAASSTTTIGFISRTTSQTKEGILCGPVIDDVVLRDLSGSGAGPRAGSGAEASRGTKAQTQCAQFLVFVLLVALLW